MVRQSRALRVPDISAHVAAPPEPYRHLLITWPLRQLRDGLRVPPPGKRSDDWAWEYEQRYGVGELLDRGELLRDVFQRLRLQQIDLARVEVVLGDVRRMAAMTYAATRTIGGRREPRTVSQRQATTERRQ